MAGVGYRDVTKAIKSTLLRFVERENSRTQTPFPHPKVFSIGGLREEYERFVAMDTNVSAR